MRSTITRNLLLSFVDLAPRADLSPWTDERAVKGTDDRPVCDFITYVFCYCHELLGCLCMVCVHWGGWVGRSIVHRPSILQVVYDFLVVVVLEEPSPLGDV